MTSQIRSHTLYMLSPIIKTKTQLHKTITYFKSGLEQYAYFTNERDSVVNVQLLF